MELTANRPCADSLGGRMGRSIWWRSLAPWEQQVAQDRRGRPRPGDQVVRGPWPLARIARSVLHPPYFKRLFNGLLQPIGPHLLRLWLLVPALWICGAEQGALTAASPGPSTREPRRGHGRGCRGGGLRAGAFWRAGPGPAAFGPHAGFDFAHSPPCDHKVPGLAFRPRRAAVPLGGGAGGGTPPPQRIFRI
jgi:hypothetical protein